MKTFHILASEFLLLKVGNHFQLKVLMRFFIDLLKKKSEYIILSLSSE